MSTIKPTIDVGQRGALAKKHGKTFTVKLTDLLKLPVSNDVDFKHLEALQMAEIAFRLRLQVSEMIREYRKLEKQWHLLHTEMEYLNSEMHERREQIHRNPSRNTVGGLYGLYKMVWRDFLYSLEWAEKLQNLKGQERVEFRRSILSTAKIQARMLYQAEKASQFAASIVTKSNNPETQQTIWRAT